MPHRPARGAQLIKAFPGPKWINAVTPIALFQDAGDKLAVITHKALSCRRHV